SLRCCGGPRDLPAYPTRRSSDLTHTFSMVDPGLGRRVAWFELPHVNDLPHRLHQPAKEGHIMTSTSLNGDNAPLTVMLVHGAFRSEEHTSELQSRENLVCRLLLE